MTDLKIILEKVDDICEKFEMEGLHTHPTYKQFKRLFTELNKMAEPVQLISYAEDMSTCTLTNGDGNGYFYNRVDPDQPATYTAVDMTTAAAQGFRDGVASVAVVLPDDGIEDCQKAWGTERCKDTFDCGYNFASWRHEQAIIAAGGSIKE